MASNFCLSGARGRRRGVKETSGEVTGSQLTCLRPRPWLSLSRIRVHPFSGGGITSAFCRRPSRTSRMDMRISGTAIPFFPLFLILAGTEQTLALSSAVLSWRCADCR